MLLQSTVHLKLSIEFTLYPLHSTILSTDVEAYGYYSKYYSMLGLLSVAMVCSILLIFLIYNSLLSFSSATHFDLSYMLCTL